TLLLDDRQHLICGDWPGDVLHRSAGPANGHLVDPGRSAQPEVDHPRRRPEGAALSVNHAELLESGGLDRDLGALRAAIGLHSLELDLEPMARVVGLVAQELEI